MGRIFLSAGHGGGELSQFDPGTIAGGTTEAKEMIQLRDLVTAELRSRSFEVFVVPDNLTLTQSLEWINTRTRRGDVALELHADGSPDPAVRGATIFYIANNLDRKNQAELVLLAVLRRLTTLPSRGVRPDTDAGTGRIAFCRDITPPSLYLNACVLTNPDDRFLLQNRRRDMALGIADGLAAWSRLIDPTTPTPTPTPTPIYPTIDISINGKLYDEQGIIVSGNSYIPLDLADSLGVDLSTAPGIIRLNHRNIVYVRAIELRNFNIAVDWDAGTRTVVIRSILNFCVGQLDRVMGHGNTSEVQLMMFLKANNEQALNQFPDLPRLYREEAAIEGVNHDLAFSQMCVETGFLRFGSVIKPSQNNFAGLGDAAGSPAGASFPSARIGVRAHIQMLKAYASTAPLVQEVVAPRFRFVTRGIAPLVDQLSGRWSAESDYGQRIMALVRRLYQSAGFL